MNHVYRRKRRIKRRYLKMLRRGGTLVALATLLYLNFKQFLEFILHLIGHSEVLLSQPFIVITVHNIVLLFILIEAILMALMLMYD
jgi:hypothetical protein